MTPIASVHDLHRHYTQGPHTIRALDGVRLDVMPGDFLALMGPSGSGKSTLLNLLGGLDRPTSGEVRVEGRLLSELSERELSTLRRDRLGFIFQAYNLIPVLSAFENAEFVLLLQGRSAAERRQLALQTLAAVGLEDMAHRRPHELSGGQQQRVAVARAIAGKPALVLADEPTANLDSATGQGLIELMQRLNREQGTTFVFATHDPKVMAAASRVVRLVDGKVTSDERRSEP